MTNDTKQFLRGWRSGVLGSVIGVSVVIALAACDSVERSDSDVARAAESPPATMPATTSTTPRPTTTIDWWTPEDQAASEERRTSGAPTDLGMPQAKPAEPVPMRHEGESRVYECGPTPDSCELNYDGGSRKWFVDGVEVTGVSCPAEDSCWAMWHADEHGWMIHVGEPPPGVDSPYVP